MKWEISRVKWIILALGIMVSVSVNVGFAGIVGTAHDLSALGYGSTEICVFCHTPHNAAAVQLAPLWNHASSTATYTLYSSSTLNATMAQPTGVSKACLSCHDGTLAIDSFGGATGTHTMTGTALLGSDLSNDHPVAFLYDTALATADGGLVTPASASLVVTGIPLFSGKLECASCHSVHDNTNAPFLRSSNAASALCLKCHNK